MWVGFLSTLFKNFIALFNSDSQYDLICIRNSLSEIGFAFFDYSLLKNKPLKTPSLSFSYFCFALQTYLLRYHQKRSYTVIQKQILSLANSTVIGSETQKKIISIFFRHLKKKIVTSTNKMSNLIYNLNVIPLPFLIISFVI